METYWNVFKSEFTGYATYFLSEITTPSWHNYLYWLLGISLGVFAIELIFPWRKQQARFRKDFWQDAFYMLFNFFLFSLMGYHALSMVISSAFNDLLLRLFGIQNLIAIHIQSWPGPVQLMILFVVKDFVQWNVHRLLHRVPFLWQVHKVHHSVQEMGFAAHLRYHFGETFVYRTFEYLPLAMIGFGIQDFIIVHLFTLLIGHLNHANFNLPLGPLKYIFNSPQMHIWHHAKHIPDSHPYGINFGITLSIWDYLFGTAVMPHDGRDIPLGFDGVESYPESFAGQVIAPFRKQS